MKDIEIEIQVKVDDSKPLLSFLEKNAAFKSEKHQVDEYFSPPHRNFLEHRPVKEWLRLRDAEGSSSLNYKNWYIDERGKSDHCDEYETKINDLDKVRKIFSALDFKSLTVVDKVRKTWEYGNYEIAIDKVKNLGDFVEVEYKGDAENPDPKKITAEMIAFLKKTGCEGIERNYVGYPFLLLFPGEVEWEKQ